MKKIKIFHNYISEKSKPFIIAEMSSNHNQSIDTAIKILEEAKKSGASAVKMQIFNPDLMTINIRSKSFRINNKNKLWGGKYLYDLYKKAYTPWEWYEKILNRAKKLNIIVFSSVFDIHSVHFLEKMNAPCYKISSFENNDYELINKLITLNKPIIISTGLSTLNDQAKLVENFKYKGFDKFVLLKCTSTYPAKIENSNILTIPVMKKIFNCNVGLSDHTLGIGASLAAIAHGASVIEKHFTLSKENNSLDVKFSLDPKEFKILTKYANQVKKSLGKVTFDISTDEKESLLFKRSLYAYKNIKIGEKINKSNVKAIRPGYGISPIYFEILLGMEAKKNIKKGTPLNWNLFK